MPLARDLYMPPWFRNARTYAEAGPDLRQAQVVTRQPYEPSGDRPLLLRVQHDPLVAGAVATRGCGQIEHAAMATPRRSSRTSRTSVSEP